MVMLLFIIINLSCEEVKICGMLIRNMLFRISSSIGLWSIVRNLVWLSVIFFFVFGVCCVWWFMNGIESRLLVM